MYFHGFFHLKSLQIKNFKCFDDLKIEFDTQISLISGLANSGKTSLFQAVNLLFNPFYPSNYDLDLNFIKQKENESTSIEAEICTDFLNEERKTMLSLISKDLKSVITKKSAKEIKINIKINSKRDDIKYFLNGIEIKESLLNEWLLLINGNIFNYSNSNDLITLKKQSIFSEGMSFELLYLIFVDHLSLSDTLDKYNSLMLESANFEEKLQKQTEVLSEAKNREKDLLQDIENLNTYNEYKEKLSSLENELLWAPVIQTEDRSIALSKTLESNILDIEKNTKEINNKELKREEIVQKTNGIEENRKKKEKEFDLLRNDYLEKKSRIDRFNKENEKYEKSLKRFTFDERQNQMKMKDYIRIMKEIDSKEKDQNTTSIIDKKKKLQIDIDSLQRELNELKEKKDVYQKEMNIKKINKKKLESSVNSSSSKMQDIRNEINALENESNLLVKENDQLYSEADELNSKNIQLKEKQTEIEKELKKMSKDKKKLNKEVSDTIAEKPDQVRALNTINTLITNTKNNLTDLENINLNFDAFEQLENHKNWIDNINDDITKILERNFNIKHNLDQWKSFWNKKLKNILEELQEKINFFLKPWNTQLIIGLNFPETPITGFLDLKCVINEEEYPLQYLSTTYKSLLNTIWHLALSMVVESRLILVDEELSKLNSSDLKKLLEKLNEGVKDEIIGSSIQIVLTHENFSLDIPYEDKFAMFHLGNF